MRPLPNYLLPLLVASTIALLATGCQPTPPEAKPDAGKASQAPPPPPPNPIQELALLNREVEAALKPGSGVDADALQKLDGKLYDRIRGMDPNQSEVQRASRLRGEIKVRMVPAYMDMAEASFKAGRYDAAARQAGFVPDRADASLVKRKKALLARMPEILRKRAACAKQHSLKACLICEEHPDWGMKTCQGLTEEMIGTDMTPEMVLISWGKPLDVEQEQEKGQLKVTWHYNRGAYVTFTGPSMDKLKVSDAAN